MQSKETCSLAHLRTVEETQSVESQLDFQMQQELPWCQLTHFQGNLEIHLKDKIKNSVKIYFEIYVKTTIYQTGLKDQEE